MKNKEAKTTSPIRRKVVTSLVASAVGAGFIGGGYVYGKFSRANDDEALAKARIDAHNELIDSAHLRAESIQKELNGESESKPVGMRVMAGRLSIEGEIFKNPVVLASGDLPPTPEETETKAWVVGKVTRMSGEVYVSNVTLLDEEALDQSFTPKDDMTPEQAGSLVATQVTADGVPIPDLVLTSHP
jgi:hypothetical protein